MIDVLIAAVLNTLAFLGVSFLLLAGFCAIASSLGFEEKIMKWLNEKANKKA